MKRNILLREIMYNRVFIHVFKVILQLQCFFFAHCCSSCPLPFRSSGEKGHHRTSTAVDGNESKVPRLMFHILIDVGAGAVDVAFGFSVWTLISFYVFHFLAFIRNIFAFAFFLNST